MSVALVRDGQVLLIRRARPPYAGLWTFPGGRLEPGESPEGAATREVREELGLEVTDLRPVMALAVGGVPPYRLQVFATELFRGEVTPSNEVSAWQWAAPDLGGLATTPHLAEVVARALVLFAGP